MQCSAEVVYVCDVRTCGIVRDMKRASVVGIVPREATGCLPREPVLSSAVAVALLAVPLVVY